MKKTTLVSTFYSFDQIDQSKNYVKICGLFMSSDKKALDRAKKINPAFDYTVETGRDKVKALIPHQGE